jgi:hypothetical protein
MSAMPTHKEGRALEEEIMFTNLTLRTSIAIFATALALSTAACAGVSGTKASSSVGPVAILDPAQSGDADAPTSSDAEAPKPRVRSNDRLDREHIRGGSR